MECIRLTWTWLWYFHKLTTSVAYVDVSCNVILENWRQTLRRRQEKKVIKFQLESFYLSSYCVCSEIALDFFCNNCVIKSVIGVKWRSLNNPNFGTSFFVAEGLALLWWGGDLLHKRDREKGAWRVEVATASNLFLQILLHRFFA